MPWGIFFFVFEGESTIDLHSHDSKNAHVFSIKYKNMHVFWFIQEKMHIIFMGMSVRVRCTYRRFRDWISHSL